MYTRHLFQLVNESDGTIDRVVGFKYYDRFEYEEDRFEYEELTGFS